VLKQSLGIFSNFGAEKPPLRQAAGRWQKIFNKILLKLIIKKKDTYKWSENRNSDFKLSESRNIFKLYFK